MIRFESSVSMPPRSLTISRRHAYFVIFAITEYFKSFASDFQLTREQEKSTYSVGCQGSYSTNRIVTCRLLVSNQVID
jgi:hypothetical protein